MASMHAVLQGLNANNHKAAMEVARLPEMIKGFGHVKARNLQLARAQWPLAMQTFHAATEGEKLAA
jgi:indolepyruvate ferredoxin oxidoreductase